MNNGISNGGIELGEHLDVGDKCVVPVGKVGTGCCSFPVGASWSSTSTTLELQNHTINKIDTNGQEKRTYVESTVS